MLKLVDIFGYLAVILSAATLVAQSLLLGGLVFSFWIARPGANLADDSLEQVRSRSLRLFRSSAIGLVLIQLLYLYVNSTVLMASAEIGFREVTGANFFIASSIMLVCSLVIVVLIALHRHTVWLLVLLVAGVLIASVMTDHAASRIEGRALLISLTLLHVTATGFWIGGLPFLLMGLHVSRERATQWYLTQRFSQLALISVVVLVASGVWMSLSYVGSWRALIGTAYGLMLLAKVAMARLDLPRHRFVDENHQARKWRC